MEPDVEQRTVLRESADTRTGPDILNLAFRVNTDVLRGDGYPANIGQTPTDGVFRKEELVLFRERVPIVETERGLYELVPKSVRGEVKEVPGLRGQIYRFPTVYMTYRRAR